MVQKELISVIIPVYNAEKYLKQTIDCLLDQTYKNIEIIIVDDCSTDGSLELAKSYIAKNIFVFQLPNNSGQCAASNFGIKKSTGKYIKLVDADDLLNAAHIEIQYLTIKEHPGLIAAGEVSRFYNDDVSTALYEPLKNWCDLRPIDWLLIDGGKGLGMMQCGSFLIPRLMLEQSGLWDERLSLINDFEFFPRVLLNATEIKYCKGAVILYRSGINNSLSNVLSKKALKSSHLALTLTTHKILTVENSTRAKKVLANYWALWAYNFYLVAPNLYRDANLKILELSGEKFKPNLSGTTKMVSSVIGWKLTKRIKKFVARF